MSATHPVNDPYAHPDGVLRNKLGITDQDALKSAEADITGARLIALSRHHIDGRYDLNHLRAFHRFVFRDVYEWAGELRTVDITKHDTFCRRIHPDAYASEVFGQLTTSSWACDADRAKFIAGLAETYADINALHPFREGNGRAQRAFLQQFAADAGRPSSRAGLDADENEAASIAGFRGNLKPLIAMFDKHVEQGG